VLAPTVLFILSLVFVSLPAVVARVLGMDKGSEVLFAVLRSLSLVKTIQGWR